MHLIRKAFFILVILIGVDFLPPSVSPSVHAQTTTATLNDYWSGKAQWILQNKLTEASTSWPHGFESSHIEVVNGTWYLFSRKYYFETDSHKKMPLVQGL